MMDMAQIIVCEHEGGWRLALEQSWRRLYAARELPKIHAARSLAECDRLLAEWPASLAAVEATEANLGALLVWLAGLERGWPHARAVVLAHRAVAGHELAMREAGAVHVATSPRQMLPVARLARRHLAKAPRVEMSFGERILAELPWND